MGLVVGHCRGLTAKGARRVPGDGSCRRVVGGRGDAPTDGTSVDYEVAGQVVARAGAAWAAGEVAPIECPVVEGEPAVVGYGYVGTVGFPDPSCGRMGDDRP